MQANDLQIAGNHYASPYQHWDFVEDALFGLYLEGQITKYVYRWRKKNGVQDLQKSAHFAQKLSESICAGYTSPSELNSEYGVDPTEHINRFIAENQLGSEEADIIRRIALWRTQEDVKHAISIIDGLISSQCIPFSS